MPMINVQMIRGRTPAQKRALIKELSEAAIRTLEVPEQAIRIILTEVEPEHWGVGSRSKAEIDAERAA
jgi:4-oxalocrotonate tautomerase